MTNNRYKLEQLNSLYMAICVNHNTFSKPFSTDIQNECLNILLP